MNNKRLAKDFCHCVKKVSKTIRLRKGQSPTKQNKESAAIATCVKSVLQTKGLTLKKFDCVPRPWIKTQPSNKTRKLKKYT